MTAAANAGGVTVACLQVNAGLDIAANVESATALVRQAAEAGAGLVLMPENVACMGWNRERVLGEALPEERHPAVGAFSALARELGIWLHGGSIAVPRGDGLAANRTLVFAPDGSIAARYDKIHMFDVDLPGGERYRESATFGFGARAATVDLPWGRLGLSICYDLRFAYLYRALARAGCTFLTVPSAFTRRTGEAHWHILLRARAIETGCFVFAPAQTGRHPGDRETYGHALIVDPWGEVLADAGTEPGIVTATIDPARVAEVRAMVPSLHHDRPFSQPA